MDLCEVTNNNNRHPWEYARLRSLKAILRMYAKFKLNLTILDVGCGDAYATVHLFKKEHVKSIDAIDIKLSEDQAMEMSFHHNFVTFYNRFENLKKNFYDLVLALDVIEHVDNDKKFLCQIADNFMKPNGYILVTTPAHQFLFSSHDRFLGHHRRYSLRDLTRVIKTAKLQPEFCGYLFLSLIPIRFFLKCFEQLFCVKHKQNRSIGDWQYGWLITRSIELVLITDNYISLILNRCGIKLPGLSVWALCKKPQL